MEVTAKDLEKENATDEVDSSCQRDLGIGA
jgi:hypothetical protein